MSLVGIHHLVLLFKEFFSFSHHCVVHFCKFLYKIFLMLHVFITNINRREDNGEGITLKSTLNSVFSWSLAQNGNNLILWLLIFLCIWNFYFSFGQVLGHSWYFLLFFFFLWIIVANSCCNNSLPLFINFIFLSEDKPIFIHSLFRAKEKLAISILGHIEPSWYLFQGLDLLRLGLVLKNLFN